MKILQMSYDTTFPPFHRTFIAYITTRGGKWSCLFFGIDQIFCLFLFEGFIIKIITFFSTPLLEYIQALIDKLISVFWVSGSPVALWYLGKISCYLTNFSTAPDLKYWWLNESSAVSQVETHHIFLSCVQREWTAYGQVRNRFTVRVNKGHVSAIEK